MRELYCPNCGTPFVRVTYQESRVDRLLGRVNVFPFRCQLCTHHFCAFYSGARHNTQAFDRRQSTRLMASIEALTLDHKQLPVANRITDISMDGYTLQPTGLPKGAFIELVLKPRVEDETIRIETAIVCSVRPSSMGIRFLEIPPEHYRRLAQAILGLLVGQGLDPALNGKRDSFHPTFSPADYRSSGLPRSWPRPRVPRDLRRRTEAPDCPGRRLPGTRHEWSVPVRWSAA